MFFLGLVAELSFAPVDCSGRDVDIPFPLVMKNRGDITHPHFDGTVGSACEGTT